MYGDDAAARQGDLPRADAPQPVPDAEDAPVPVIWDGGNGDDSTDPYADNAFSLEIESVDAADWDIDASLIWGDDDRPALGDEGTQGLDFAL
jgi:hypothetical protein